MPPKASAGGLDSAETFQLRRRTFDRRQGHQQGDPVDHPNDIVSLAIEVQGAVGEVLHDPLRLGDLATGRQTKRSEFVAEGSPCLIDRASKGLSAGLW